jgi:DNA modification methylase
MMGTLSAADGGARIIVADCVEAMRSMPAGSVHCCVTSPPYWGLRDYGNDGQIGLEATPDEYVARMVGVFREVRRVLRDDGTLWLNLGDSYASSPASGGAGQQEGGAHQRTPTNGYRRPPGLKAKDLVGIPWRVAFALQADGWWLRQDIIWHKPNPMPESVTDRCTKAHEYVFLLSKSARYFYDADAISERAVLGQHVRRRSSNFKKAGSQADKFGSHNKGAELIACDGTRNKRSVWTIATAPYKGAHFAVFPPKLIEPCLLAGCPVGGTVLDPFGGAGTTAVVAIKHGRKAVLCELNPDYAEMARRRIDASSAQRSLLGMMEAV